VSNINKTTGNITINGTFNKNKVTFVSAIPIGVSTTATGNDFTSSNPQGYAASLSVNTAQLMAILAQATIVNESIAAEEQAIYEIMVIKVSTS
jgi:hypothetical protein